MAETVGARLEEARKNKGLSRETVATRMGLSVSTIQAYENDRNELRPSGLARFARLYGISIEWLVTGRDLSSPEVVGILNRITDEKEREAWINMGRALTKDSGS